MLFNQKKFIVSLQILCSCLFVSALDFFFKNEYKQYQHMAKKPLGRHEVKNVYYVAEFNHSWHVSELDQACPVLYNHFVPLEVIVC